MAFNLVDINRHDHQTRYITKMFNDRYGEDGRVYIEHNMQFFKDVYVYDTSDRIRKFTYDEFNRDYTLIEEIYRNRNNGHRDYHSSLGSQIGIQPSSHSPAFGANLGITAQWIEPPDEIDDSIQAELQKEVDEWLKDIGV